MPATETIDRAALKTLLDSVGGDREFLGELLDAYFVDAPRLLRAIQQAITTNQPAQLQLAAHSLKSASATFGATPLSLLCKELEYMGRAGTVDGADERASQVVAEYARVQAALNTVRATNES